MTKQQHLRQRLSRMPLKHLRDIADHVQSLIQKLEGASIRREIDIAADHEGNVDLIHSIVRTMGNQRAGRWQQVEKIYCCREHCPRCPHGEFIFRYRRNKRKRSVTVTFVGMPALPNDILEQMQSDVRDPHPYLISIAPDGGVDHDS